MTTDRAASALGSPRAGPAAPDEALRVTPADLGELRALAARLGLLELGIVSLADPGWAAAHQRLRDYLDGGLFGEMAFMARTRALRLDPRGLLPGARSVLIAAVPYEGAAGPVARYAQGADYHTVVHRRLEALARALAARWPGLTHLVCVDTKPLLERAAAQLAKLGFIGKHGCVIVPGLGSYVLLGALLTNLEWQPEPEPAPRAAASAPPWDACGSCRRCLDACPTAAFDGPGQLDPRRCIAYLTIEHRGPIDEALADGIGERVAGCDRCQEVCPYNGGRAALREPSVASALLRPEPKRAAVDLVRLARLGNNQHRQWVKGSALMRIPRRSVRRNALLALSNRPGPLEPAEREAVAKALEDPDPLVRAAAARVLRKRAG